MYSCEKLARGASGGIIRRGKISEHDLQLYTKLMEEGIRKKDKYQYNFADPRKYNVQEEKDINRLVGRLYRSRILEKK